MEIFLLLILLMDLNIQVEDICQTLISMDKLSLVLNNNGCTETIILKHMSKIMEDGISFSLVLKMHQKVTALTILPTIPLQILLQELLKNLT